MSGHTSFAKLRAALDADDERRARVAEMKAEMERVTDEWRTLLAVVKAAKALSPRRWLTDRDGSFVLVGQAEYKALEEAAARVPAVWIEEAEGVEDPGGEGGAQ